MHRRGTVWHVLFAQLLWLGASGALSGCYLFHEREAPRSTPVRADAAVFRADASAGAPRADAGAPARVDASFAAAPDRCAELIAAIRGGAAPGSLGCDGRTFPRGCTVAVGMCCQLNLECATDPGDGGTLQWSLACDDSCDQRCGAYSLEDCLLVPGCERFEFGGCGDPPEGVIAAPACIDRRSSPCFTDADCSGGERCQSYWIDPCAGLPCDACGGIENACAR